MLLKDIYNDLPIIAKWKALLLEYGVDMDQPYAFNRIDGIEQYKVKYRQVKPVSKDFRTFDVSDDKFVIPSEILIYFENNYSIVKLRYNENSPIEIRVTDEGIILIDKTIQMQISLRVELVRKKTVFEEIVPYTINGIEDAVVGDFIDLVGMDRLSVLAFDGCWNWSSGKACKFCDLHPKREDHRSARPTLNTLKDFDFNIESWWKAYGGEYLKGIKYAFDYILRNGNIEPHKHLVIMAGNLPQPEDVWNIYEELVQVLNEVSDITQYDNYLNICPHPNIDYAKRMKGLGINQVQYNLETIGEESFAEACPGKTKYDKFVSKLIEAVDIFGFGNVRSNFVLGIQPLETLLEGIEGLASKGIVADYSVFQPKRATPWEHRPAPDMDTIVNFTKELCRIYSKYDFRPIYCNVGSRSSIINECMMTSPKYNGE